jgi:hypothetical protein
VLLLPCEGIRVGAVNEGPLPTRIRPSIFTLPRAGFFLTCSTTGRSSFPRRLSPGGGVGDWGNRDQVIRALRTVSKAHTSADRGTPDSNTLIVAPGRGTIIVTDPRPSSRGLRWPEHHVSAACHLSTVVGRLTMQSARRAIFHKTLIVPSPPS